MAKVSRDLEYSVVELFMRKMQEHFQAGKKKKFDDLVFSLQPCSQALALETKVRVSKVSKIKCTGTKISTR